MVRHFLTILPVLPINRDSVKAGNNPSEVVTAARCVNIGLFLSHNLRRDVIVSIAYGPSDDTRVISFPGETLKRVSPDERSISFFLLKANEIANNLVLLTQRTMDNGIVVGRHSINHLIETSNPNNVYLAAKRPFQPGAYHSLARNSLFVYAVIDNFEPEGIDFEQLPRPSTPERHILEVNTYFDSKE